MFDWLNSLEIKTLCEIVQKLSDRVDELEKKLAKLERRLIKHGKVG